MATRSMFFMAGTAAAIRVRQLQYFNKTNQDQDQQNKFHFSLKFRNKF